MGIIYLEMDYNIQVPLEGRRQGLCLFLAAADSDNTSVEYMCPSGHFGQTRS